MFVDRVAELGYSALALLDAGWGTEDLAVGEAAAVNTAAYVGGPYAFERLQGLSHWLLDETSIWINTRLSRHLTSARPR